MQIIEMSVHIKKDGIDQPDKGATIFEGGSVAWPPLATLGVQRTIEP